ncbi:MAG: polysulfide reductase NrfD [Chloroflexi bacterium]|nr:polysulfide reductase NrfD [Chloroflexota bacterium]
MLRIDPEYKKKLIDPLFAPLDLNFKLSAGVLLALIGWGALLYFRQIFLGLGVTGMGRPVYWSMYIVNFIFFIGISHAGTLISAILRVTGAEWRRPITRVAEAITVFALIIGSMQILIDMGRIDRLPFTVIFGRLQSPIMWDIISVTLYLLGSVTYLFLPLMPDLAIIRDNLPPGVPEWRRKFYTILSLGWRGTKAQWVRLEKAIAFMAVFIIPVAVSVHSIISWILASTLQPGWHSTIFGPYFVIGAIFSGIGALFIAMTAVRKVFGLEKYIALKQYRYLGLLFIAMNAIWFYFTFAENLGIATGQQTYEMPILAVKLWGEFAPTFWLMIACMAVAFYILVVPPMLKQQTAQRTFVFQPRFARMSAIVAAVLVGLLVVPNLVNVPFLAVSGTTVAATVLWILLILNVLGFLLSVSQWLKANPVTSIVIASALVVVGMWLERWNIVLPTVTHPMLVSSSTYTPSLTEISIMVASISGFMLMFMIFFKLFPPISIWELAEGNIIEQAQSRVVIPQPEISGD